MKYIRTKIRHASLLLLIGYACIIIYFVLFSDSLGRQEAYSTYRYNIVPFQEISRFIKYRHIVPLRVFVLNILGNMVVFWPIGFLIPILRLLRGKNTGGIRIIIYTFLFSLSIETLQLITRVGVFDVDDLIMNSIGGWLGWLCYEISMFIYRRTVHL